jgi:hypothetical protein
LSAAIASSVVQKQIAGPVKLRCLRGAMPVLVRPDSGARLPRSSTMAGLGATGRAIGRITSSSATATSRRLSATLWPVTVGTLVSSKDSSCFISARAPPAASNSSIVCSPIGRTPASTGVCGPRVSNRW